jgi:hypothetical protein
MTCSFFPHRQKSPRFLCPCSTRTQERSTASESPGRPHPGLPGAATADRRNSRCPNRRDPPPDRSASRIPVMIRLARLLRGTPVRTQKRGARARQRDRIRKGVVGRRCPELILDLNRSARLARSTDIQCQYKRCSLIGHGCKTEFFEPLLPLACLEKVSDLQAPRRLKI